MTWVPPTSTQQKGLAYAPLPFAVISFLSSSFVIYHILCQQPEKKKRLYHRLVLAMNLALLPQSFSNIWATWAVPEGTPNYANAVGSVNTCTAQGFISFMFGIVVSVYYGSLVLQAFMGIKNNFREEKYSWIEYVVHIVAYGWGLALAAVIAATENLNPNGAGCFYAKYPPDCDNSDPDGIPCERGEDIDVFIFLFLFTQVILYVIFPPSVILTMYCWIKKMEKISSKRFNAGMSVLREAFRKQMMQNMYKQVSLYLLSFWFTWMFGAIHFVYKTLSGDPAYGLHIFANCIFAFQGFVMMMVYFTLQKMGRPKVDIKQESSFPRPGYTKQLTVQDIRASAAGKSEGMSSEVISESLKSSFNFNIFDGTPNEDSPWAMFIDPDTDNEEESPEELNNNVLRDELQQTVMQIGENKEDFDGNQ